MSYSALKTALAAAGASSTGIAVCWADQAAPRPAYPYLVLNLIGDLELGTGDVRRTVLAAPTGVPGADLQDNIRHDLELALSAQVLAKPGLGFDATAEHYLTKFRAALLTYATVAQALRAAGAAVSGATPVRNLSGGADGSTLLKAQMDVALNAAETEAPVTERGTYIDKVQGVVHLTQLPHDVVIDVDASGG